MTAESQEWIDWSKYLPEMEANDCKFRSVGVMKKLAFLLLKQSFVIMRIPSADVSSRFEISHPLLIGIAENAKGVVMLAREGCVNEMYMVLRSLVERIVTFYYLQFCDESERQDYKDYSLHKTLSQYNREISINGKTFSIETGNAPEIQRIPELKVVVDKFTSKKSKKPITRWSNTSIETKLEIIDRAGEVDIRRLMIMVLTIYDDASEALHGTVYGCFLHLGGLKPGVRAKDTKEVVVYQQEQMSMFFFMFILILGDLVDYILKHVELDGFFRIARQTVLEAGEILRRWEENT